MCNECLEEKIIYGKLTGMIRVSNSCSSTVLLGGKGLRDTREDNVDSYFAEINSRIAIMDQKRENTSFRSIYSCRKYIGKWIVFCKNIIRNCLKWYIEPICFQQTEFNNAVTPVIGRLTELQDISFSQLKRCTAWLEDCQSAQKEAEEQIMCFTEQSAEISAIGHEIIGRAAQTEQFITDISTKYLDLQQQMEQILRSVESEAALTQKKISGLQNQMKGFQKEITNLRNENKALRAEWVKRKSETVTRNNGIMGKRVGIEAMKKE